MFVVATEKVSEVGLAPVKVALPVGTIAGDQLALVFQFAPGPAHVASCAAAGAAISADDASSAARHRAR